MNCPTLSAGRTVVVVKTVGLLTENHVQDFQLQFTFPHRYLTYRPGYLELHMPPSRRRRPPGLEASFWLLSSALFESLGEIVRSFTDGDFI